MHDLSLAAQSALEMIGAYSFGRWVSIHAREWFRQHKAYQRRQEDFYGWHWREEEPPS